MYAVISHINYSTIHIYAMKSRLVVCTLAQINKVLNTQCTRLYKQQSVNEIVLLNKQLYTHYTTDLTAKPLLVAIKQSTNLVKDLQLGVSKPSRS